MEYEINFHLNIIEIATRDHEVWAYFHQHVVDIIVLTCGKGISSFRNANFSHISFWYELFLFQPSESIFFMNCFATDSKSEISLI